MLSNKGYPVRKKKAEAMQKRLVALSNGTFISMKPAPLTYNKRDKAGYLERREEGIASQRRNRDDL